MPGILTNKTRNITIFYTIYFALKKEKDMLKNRFSRFLVLLLMGGAALGVLYFIEISGFGDTIFPNWRSNTGFHLWMPVLPPLAVCLVGQLLGDIFNIKAINESGFVTFLKQIIFIATTVFMTVWYVNSFESDYSVKETAIESAFNGIGMAGPVFVYLAYAVSYIVQTKKKLYPFFFIISSAAVILVDFLVGLLPLPAETVAFWLFIGLLVLPVVLWFAKPDERPFEEYYDLTPTELKKQMEELPNFGDPDLRPGIDDDYDSNGYYVGAKCRNCAYYETVDDKYGFPQPYCRRGNRTDCSEYGYCSKYKRNYE